MNYSTFEMPCLNVKRLKTDLILNYKRLGFAGIMGICAIAHSQLLWASLRNDIVDRQQNQQRKTLIVLKNIFCKIDK